MLPGTRRFLAGHRTCTRALRSSFHATYEKFTLRKHHWVSGHILKMRPAVPGVGSLEVPFRIADTYVCIPLPRKPCKQRVRRHVREERMYLAPDSSGRWRIAKVGAILQDMELQAPQFSEAFFFAPATQATLRKPAGIPPPPFSCTGTPIASAADPLGDVTGPDYETISSAPWLDATSLEIVPMGPDAICVAIGLAEEPHPDSSYYLFWHHPESERDGRWPVPNGQTVANLGSVAGWGEPEVEIGVDGNGVPHATINSVGAETQPSLAPYLPRFGFSDGKLEIELTAHQGFPLNERWAIFPVLNPEPTWIDSLLRRPLLAEDRVPDNECVLYPSGMLVQEFFCQEPSG